MAIFPGLVQPGAWQDLTCAGLGGKRGVFDVPLLLFGRLGSFAPPAPGLSLSLKKTNNGLCHC